MRIVPRYGLKTALAVIGVLAAYGALYGAQRAQTEESLVALLGGSVAVGAIVGWAVADKPSGALCGFAGGIVSGAWTFGLAAVLADLIATTVPAEVLLGGIFAGSTLGGLGARVCSRLW